MKNTKQHIGIHFHLEKNHQQIYWITAIKNKEGLEILNSGVVSEISQLDLKDSLVSMIVTGRGIVARKNEFLFSEKNKEQQLRRILGNVDIEEFIINVVNQNREDYIYFANRKIVKEFLELKQLIYFSISLSSLMKTISLFQQEDGVYSIGNWEILIEGNEIKNIKKSALVNKEFEFPEPNLRHPWTLAFSAILGNLQPTDIKFDNQNELIQKNIKDVNLSTNLSLFNKGLLFAIIMIGLITAFFRNKQKNEKIILNQAYSSSRSKILTRDSLKLKYTVQTQLLDLIPFLNGTPTSFYLDKIAKTVPEGIVLLRVNVFPYPESRDKTKLPSSFEFNKLFISGCIEENNVLNLWISELESFPWCSKVELLPFSIDNNGNSIFQMELLIL